ncbi:ribosome small subunit-dependent GTPase A [Chryseomicrobium palamuruense]|uniref:Small ribosomal subunit biogenesis GTPase RsgA n=1 Tax=Chryseomicrobium palamuruense TaxID=682973 RepID=A0ABV8UT18_9BACL
MPTGQIRKALSGYYYIFDGGQLVQTRARGVFRKRGQSPLVGDFVTYTIEGENDGTVTEIEPRKNELVRPPIANIDQALLVFSVTEPDFNLHLLDRFITVIEGYEVEPVLILTKVDLLEEVQLEEVKKQASYYESIGYTLLYTYKGDVSLKDRLHPILEQQTSVLAGQSGVGKSTLLNTLLPTLSLKTGEISNALGRGKHTTRHVELIEVAEGLLADTPGFSTFEMDHIEKEDLSSCFTEMSRYSCKFRGCMHVKEPGCAVKEAVEQGQIATHRYDHYLHFLEEITDRKPRY